MLGNSQHFVARVEDLRYANRKRIRMAVYYSYWNSNMVLYNQIYNQYDRRLAMDEFYDGKPLFEVAFWVDGDVLDNSDYLALYTDDKIEAKDYLEEKIKKEE